MTLSWNRSFDHLQEDDEVLLACLAHDPKPMQVVVLARWHAWMLSERASPAAWWWQLTLTNDPLPGYFVPYAWAAIGDRPAYEVAP